jgi:hypothetical protein
MFTQNTLFNIVLLCLLIHGILGKDKSHKKKADKSDKKHHHHHHKKHKSLEEDIGNYIFDKYL